MPNHESRSESLASHLCCGRLIPQALWVRTGMSLRPRLGKNDPCYEYTIMMIAAVVRCHSWAQVWNPFVADSDDIEDLKRLFERDFGGYTGPLFMERCGEGITAGGVEPSSQRYAMFKVTARAHRSADGYFRCLKRHLELALQQKNVVISRVEVGVTAVPLG